MGAIARRYSVTEAVINALSANVDMVMVGNLDVDEFEDIIDKIEESVAEGVIKKEQINASLLRTELVKNAVGIRKQLVYDEEDILKLLNDKNHISFIRKFFNK